MVNRDCGLAHDWLPSRHHHPAPPCATAEAVTPDGSVGSEQVDLAAELKRLHRENEVLRQERDILKRATAFFAREGSR